MADHFEVHSAGLQPHTINPYTYKVMEEIGYDLSDQTSKSLFDYYMKAHIGYLVTVCSEAEASCPTLPGVDVRMFWPFVGAA